MIMLIFFLSPFFLVGLWFASFVASAVRVFGAWYVVWDGMQHPKVGLLFLLGIRLYNAHVLADNCVHFCQCHKAMHIIIAGTQERSIACADAGTLPFGCSNCKCKRPSLLYKLHPIFPSLFQDVSSVPFRPGHTKMRSIGDLVKNWTHGRAPFYSLLLLERTARWSVPTNAMKYQTNQTCH